MRDPSRLLRDVLLAVIAPAVVVAAIYLVPFMHDHTTMPFGFDTASYLWRTNLVHDLGVSSLNPDVLGERKALGSRPAYPVVLSLLRSSTGESSLALAWVTPALLGVVIALGAAAVAADGLGEPRWRSGTVAVAVAASAFIAWTAVGYATALAFDAIAIAIVLVALRVAAGDRGIVGGALLLAGGALQHWMFATVLAAVLAGFAALLGITRALRARRDASRAGMSGARLGLMLGVGVVLAGLAFLLAPELPGALPKVTYGGVGALIFIRERLPSMALALTLPLAAAGALLLASPLGTASVAEEARPLRRWSAVLLALWACLAVVGLVGWYVLHLSIPPYRWAAFALAIPVLIVLGVQVLGGWLGRRAGLAGGAVGVIVSVAAVVALAGAGASVWWHRAPRMDATQLAQLATADAYVRGVPEGVPIVVLIDAGVRFPPIDIIRAGLPASRIPDITTAEATILRDGSLEQDAAQRAAVPAGAVVLVLDAFRRGPAPTGTLLGPGVTLIAGPAPAEAIPPGALPRAPSGPALFALCAVAVLILGAAGSGWSGALTDLGWFGSLALAPGFGMALLGLTGTAASRFGVALHGGGGMGVVAATTAGGWIVWVCLRRRPTHRTRPRTDPARDASAPPAHRRGAADGLPSAP